MSDEAAPRDFTLGRRLAAETAGSALLLAAVVGSGIMGERLAGGNAAVALLANTLATGAAQLFSEFVATVTARSVADLGLAEGAPIVAAFKASAAHLIGPG